MSFLRIAAISATCPSCGATRQIPRMGGSGHVQIGDEAVYKQTALQRKRGEVGLDLYYLDAWCESCAEPVLRSRPQALAEALISMGEMIEHWDSALRLRSEARLLAGLPERGSAESGRSWLKAEFPVLFHECFEDPRCGLYPEFAVKMRKRFRTQAGRKLEHEGVPIPDGFGAWLASEALASRAPLEHQLDSLEQQIQDLARAIPGPWRLAVTVDLEAGISLNPYIEYEGTIFQGEGASTILHFLHEQSPENLVVPYRRALERPLLEPREYGASSNRRNRIMELIEALLEGAGPV